MVWFVRTRWDQTNGPRAQTSTSGESPSPARVALIIVRFRDGKQGEWRNKEKVWELVGDLSDFMRSVQHQVKGHLVTGDPVRGAYLIRFLVNGIESLVDPTQEVFGFRVVRNIDHADRLSTPKS